MVLFSYYPIDPRPRRAAEALASSGMTVEVICLREDRTVPKREVVNNVDIRRITILRNRRSVFEYFYQYLAFLLISSAIVAVRSFRRRYDLVYVHNMPDFLVLSGLIPKAAFGAKMILDIHDPMPELMMTIFDLPRQAKSVRFLKVVEKWSTGLVDSVITVNRTCAELFASRSCPSQKITVIMNSPDEETFQFRPQSPRANPAGSSPFVIMYHGSLVERNGVDLAVEALARVRRSIPSAELMIYGTRNRFLESVMDSVRNQGLEQAVHYLGPKSLGEIVKAIEKCDVGIIPNRRSIFTELNTPTRIFEYLSVGKPVIAPRAPGICDYFDDESLIFFELGNAEDLARKIEYVFHHPDEVMEITRRGQEVHRIHAWPEERLKLTAVVAELLRV